MAEFSDSSFSLVPRPNHAALTADSAKRAQAPANPPPPNGHAIKRASRAGQEGDGGARQSRSKGTNTIGPVVITVIWIGHSTRVSSSCCHGLE